MRDRIATVKTALAEANAELASIKKRQTLLVKMSEKKEVAFAKYMDDWHKKEMAKIEKALKPKSRKRR